MQILAIGGPYASAPVNAPTSLSAGSLTTSSADISFTAPTNDGGATITNYEYSFNNSTWTAISPADATSPVTISGLSSNTVYTIYLRAVNIVGSGPASNSLSFTTAGNPMVATGGTTETYTSGGYTYKSHTFTTSGTFSISSIGDYGNTIDYLLVAGGGGFGCGGAGGMRELTTTVSATNYSITVGAGTTSKGGNSSAFGQSSTGGGKGYVYYSSGEAGGCGGGAGGANNGQVYGSGGPGNQGGYSPVEGYGGGGSGYDNLGGGGGAGGAGSSNGTGGAARASSLKTGSPINYSKGGQYGGDTSAGTGNGGVYWSGGTGASGTVIIRYRIG